jgi:pimeloyl-ACP methyl ester carboxylesterase
MLVLSQLKAYLLSLLLLAFVVGCKTGSDPAPGTQNSFLTGSTVKAQLTPDQLKARLGSSNPIFAAFVKYGVKVYALTYKTQTPDGQTVTASGAILVPDTQDALPMVSQQHGTITDDGDAPSNYGTGSDAYQAATVFASLGYIMVCPDYLGYGASKSIPHTYEHRQGLAQASLDMLRAAREFCQDNNVKWDNRLYLTGYSEGGYATMALLKLMEDKYPTEFNLRAVTAGAGAYNKTAFMKQIINAPTSGKAEFNRLYVWVLRTYNTLYKLNRPMSYYFKAPYAAEAEKGLDANINVSLDQTFNDSFKKAINDGTDKDFAAAVADNDIYDWKPKTPLRLYHGDADDLVFYFNSKTAYDAMRARGATNVDLVTLPGANHYTGVSGYILGTYDFLSVMK